MTERNLFLANVRERLARPAPQHELRPVAPVPDEPIDYTVELDDLPGQFVAAATGSGAEVARVTDAGSLVEVVMSLTPERVALADHPSLAPIAAALVSRQVEIVPIDDARAVAAADLGITGAAGGIALTGSLVIDTADRGARLASLLPESHLAVLDVRSIVPTPGDILRAIPTRLTPLPSNLVLITGPSRSADIELQLTVGVHGPRRLLIALMG